MPLIRVVRRVSQSHVAVINLATFNDHPEGVTRLTIEAQSSNDDTFTTLDFSHYRSLQELRVMDGSLKRVKDLKLHGLTSLVKVEIEGNCFSEADGVLEVINCSSLCSIAVGNNSFQHAKAVKIANLPLLKSVTFGEGSFGSSFDGSFEMRYCGKKAEEAIVRKPSKGTSAEEEVSGLVIGNNAFKHWNEFIISDCSLKRIEVGDSCFKRCEYAVFNGRLQLGCDNT